MKIYLGKDGRRRVFKKYPNGKSKIITYVRFLMEKKLDRELSSQETVDHIDRDRLNDTIENLRIVSRSRHVTEDNLYAKKIKFKCILCGSESERRGNHLDHNANQGKAGPFCGKSCAGKYGKMVQMGKINKLPAQPKVKREYFYLNKAS